MMQVAEIAPVMDYLDTDKLVKYLVEVTGIPARVVRSDQEVEEMREQKQAQQAQQMQLDQQTQTAEAMGAAAPMVKAVGGLDMLQQ